MFPAGHTHAFTFTLKCGVRVRKMCLRPQDSISNLACDSELLFILFWTLAAVVVLFISDRVSRPHAKRGGIRSARSADSSRPLIVHMVH
jgi:hypothetical protein